MHPQKRRAVFAIPGDINQRTGGYIYEKSLLLALRAGGRNVRHLELPASFPNCGRDDMATTVEALATLPDDEPLILDGLVYGAIETDGLARVRAPIIAMIHHPLGLETGLPPARARELLKRETANLALARHVLVPSPHTKRVLAADFGVPADRITVAPPGFAQPAPGGLPKMVPPLILSVGLLAERKGHDVLVRALSRIADLDWRAMIVGGTHDREVADRLASQIRQTGLEDRITLAGSLSSEELDTLYRTATLFALATRYEGYGMVFSEAIAHGLPVVTCRAGAVPDTLPQGSGILVDVDDEAAFAEALSALLLDADARGCMSLAAAAAGAALPNWADTARIADAVLDRV